MNIPVLGSIKVRFYIQGADNPVQDYALPSVPRSGDRVELALADGFQVTMTVTQVTWTPHDQIPADVVVMLGPFQCCCPCPTPVQ